MTNYTIIQAICEVESIRDFLATMRGIAGRHNTHIICLNADVIAGRRHAETALEHAWRSTKSGEPIARTPEMEVLLYASGSRQCQDASSFGIHEGKNRCYFCIMPADMGAERELDRIVTVTDEDWEIIDDKKAQMLMELFGITAEEVEVVGRERLRELVIERVALLDVYR